MLIDLIAKAGAATLVLLATTTISVYKPWGRIQFKKPADPTQEFVQGKKELAGFYLFIGLIILVVMFIIIIIIHLFNGNMIKH